MGTGGEASTWSAVGWRGARSLRWSGCYHSALCLDLRREGARLGSPPWRALFGDRRTVRIGVPRWARCDIRRKPVRFARLDRSKSLRGYPSGPI